MKKEYQSEVLYIISGTIFLFVVLVVMSCLLFYVARLLNAAIPTTIAWCCLLLMPYLFEKRLKALFTKRAFLEFDDASFSITTCNLKNDNDIKELIYDWDTIKSYRFYFSSRKQTHLDIFLKNGSHKKIIFNDNKTQEESMNSESVFSLFYTYVKNFNARKDINDEKIVFQPGFLTTKTGTNLMYVVFALIIISISIHVVKHNSSFPFLLIGICSFIPMIYKRKQDIAFYEKMKSLD